MCTRRKENPKYKAATSPNADTNVEFSVHWHNERACDEDTDLRPTDIRFVADVIYKMYHLREEVRKAAESRLRSKRLNLKNGIIPLSQELRWNWESAGAEAAPSSPSAPQAYAADTLIEEWRVPGSTSLSQPSPQSSYQNTSPTPPAMTPLAGTPLSSYEGYSYSPNNAIVQNRWIFWNANGRTGGHVVHGSPTASSPNSGHEHSGHKHSAQSGLRTEGGDPTFSNAPGSPGLSRHPLVAHGGMVAAAPGSPGLARHQAVMTGSAPVTPGSPSMERHAITTANAVPTEHSAGYRLPAAPDYLVYPAYYQSMAAIVILPSTPPVRQASPVPQPSLHVKKRRICHQETGSNSLTELLHPERGRRHHHIRVACQTRGKHMGFTHTFPDFSSSRCHMGVQKRERMSICPKFTSKYCTSLWISRDQADSGQSPQQLLFFRSKQGGKEDRAPRHYQPKHGPRSANVDPQERKRKWMKTDGTPA
ncbi:unnamed protein product, partial [Ranitomeya imitator]